MQDLHFWTLKLNIKARKDRAEFWTANLSLLNIIALDIH